MGRFKLAKRFRFDKDADGVHTEWFVQSNKQIRKPLNRPLSTEHGSARETSLVL